MRIRCIRPSGPGGAPSGSARPHRAGFTLVELLVVMAILALLAALVMTGAGRAMRRARQAQCLSNLRQMGAAVQLFAEDRDGVLPGTSHGVSWVDSLGTYLGTNFIGRCPAVRQHRARMTYGWNDCLATNGAGMKLSACRAPGDTMAVAELAPDQSSEHFHFAGVRGGAGRLTPNQFMAEVNVTAHGTGANYLFVDGRTENIAWTDVQRRLQQAESAFIVP